MQNTGVTFGDGYINIEHHNLKSQIKKIRNLDLAMALAKRVCNFTVKLTDFSHEIKRSKL